MRTQNITKFGLAVVAFASLALVGCKKNKCAECHYDASNGSEVEIGEYCGDDLEDIESKGYSDGTTTYEVHCGEH